METFADFQNKYIVQNRLLMGAIISTLVLSSVVIFAMATHRGIFFVQSKGVFSERPLAEEVCLQSFESIVSGEPQKNIISSGILEVLEKTEFDLVVDEILLLKSTEENKCRIVVKSGGTLVSFLITLEASSSFPFHYKLFRLDEIPIHSEEEL